ncbi:T9SS type A sorting domain-containing protein [bacterium SCSIO 12741]|nr:T9SS type A sorting domain-containing protein [bacterium SCSIO 12741]
MKINSLALLTFLQLFIIHQAMAQKFSSQGFLVPDTVCVSDSFDIVSSNAPEASYLWTFCQPDFSQNFTQTSIGNPGSQLNTCNNGDLIFDGTNYYLFITNYNGNIIRLDFGNSALNTPTATNIGNPVTGSDRLAGVQIVKDNGNYYLFYVGRGCGLTRLDFGNNLTSTPTVNQLGSLGMSWPHEMVILKENGSWYGFVINRFNSKVTQLNFGTSITNTPTRTDHRPSGAGMSQSRGLTPIKHNGNWYIFVTNLNNTLSRFDFGNSLNNTPTASNFGNPGNRLKNPLSLVFLKDCSNIYAYVANESGGAITELKFNATLDTITATKNLGNRGMFNHPTSFIPHTENGNLYLFLSDWGNSSIYRLNVTTCTGTIANQSKKEPKNLVTTQTGTLPLTLLRDFGLPHQETVCENLTAAVCCFKSTVDTVDACQSYIWNGQTYTSNNFTDQDTIRTAAGCDSIVTLNLTIHQPDSTVDVIQSCGSYTWNGVTYTKDNFGAKDTLINQNGCDSVVTLSLTIYQPDSSVETIQSCGSYTWKGTTYTSSNYTDQDTLQTSHGCDSIITLNLTIHQVDSTVDVIQSCGSYTWNGVTYTSDNHTAQDTLVGRYGCDSVVTLNLTIVESKHTVDSISACDSYTWNGTTYTSSNYTASHTLSSHQGCDSVVQLALTLHHSQQTTDSITAFNTYTWNGVTYSSSNYTAMDTLTDIHGCDSVVTLALTIIINSTGEAHNHSNKTLQLYPNPTSGLVHLKMANMPSGSYTLAIYNMIGAIVHQQEVMVDAREQVLDLDLRSVPKGKYWIRVEGASGSTIPQVVGVLVR